MDPGNQVRRDGENHRERSVMKRSTVVFLIMALLASATVDCARGCTTLFMTHEDGPFAGFNLDYNNFYPRIWVVPASEGRYGRFCFGFDENYKIAEGGLNEKGLFIAANALNEDAGWKPDPDLPNWEEWSGWFETGVPDGILAKCATVDEAVRVFKEYNLFTLNRVKFLIADRAGASLVIECSRDGLAFVERAQEYQISTNFVTANYAPGQYPCGRYAVADAILSADTGTEPVALLRAALSATHLEFLTPTVYSNICNLGTGDILIYYFHNYEAVAQLNLFEELRKGEARYLVESLFAVKPFVSEAYKKYMKRG
jgi:hypothetical protein